MADNDVATKKSFSLADLGLVYEAQEGSEPQFRIIDLDVDPMFGTGTCQAVYNEQTRRWRIVTTSHVRFMRGTIPTWQSPTTSNTVTRGKVGQRPPQWTDKLPYSKLVDHFCNGVDWAATSLGPLHTWPISVQTMVSLVFADSRAAVLYCRPDLVAIPNQVMLDHLIGRLHKDENFMGRTFQNYWPELHDFQSMFDDIRRTGVGVTGVEVNLFPTKNGVKEEQYWTGEWLPIRNDMGEFAGFYNIGVETTMQTMRERRLKTLNLIASPQIAGTSDVWDHVFTGLHHNERDLPMAFAYSASPQIDGDLENYQLRREQSLGVPDNHPLVPHHTSLFEGGSGFQPYFRKAKATNRAIILRLSEGNLPEELLQGFTWRGFGEPSRVLAIFPISAGETLKGMMVVGFNPRRPWNEDYEGFIFSLHSQISATVSAALDHEEARQRAARLTLELQESERHIRDLAEYAPIGMVRLSPTGTVIWANDQFYDLTGHAKGEESHFDLSFVDLVDKEDQAAAGASWAMMVEQHKDTSINVRLKKKWKPPAIPGEDEPKEESMWVLARAYPVIQDGLVKSIAAAVVDISHYKWAAAVQERAAQAAKEAKRLQENFIDIVSHEMRNPLSAITQLSDAISASVDDFDSSTADLAAAKDILGANVESAKTILICAAHQKRIIDDVLTLSKLDSMMLSITPVVVQPYSIVDSVLKMFEGEFLANDIKIHPTLDDTYQKHKIDWVCIDPSRLTQIFINLITNAIKFTKLEHKRAITIKTSASIGVTPRIEGLTWFPSDVPKKDITISPEWGTGEHLYLCYQVTDTGPGLEQAEMMRLFTRFQQATAKTHIKYGGSGLGLFISRQLTEAQGGEVGVSSQPGVGSTFAFYIKGRRATVPSSPEQVLQPPETANLRRRSAGYSNPVSPSPTPGTSALRPKATRSQSSSTQITKPTILMVEDNVVNAKVLSAQLTKSGCSVQTANHGMEALDLLYPAHASTSTAAKNGSPHGLDFDVILMDVEMPIMDGLTATRRIRQLEKEQKLVKKHYIIAITANARQEQIDATVTAGADAVVSKPFRVAELMAKIKEMMATKVSAPR